MTLFLKILIKLIDEKLADTAKSLKKKSDSYGYDNELSRKMHMQVEALREALGNQECLGDDDKNHQAIISQLEKYRATIKGFREEHQQSGVSGKTMPTMNALVNYTKEAYNKLCSYSFKLLNLTYDYESPEGVIYYHAALYLIRSIFEDQPQKDPVRNKKEEALANRLAIFSKLLLQDNEFDVKLKHGKQFLTDMRGDNTVIASNGKGVMSNLKVTIFSVMEFSGNTGALIDSHTSTLVENLNMIETKLKSMEKSHLQVTTAPTV